MLKSSSTLKTSCENSFLKKLKRNYLISGHHTCEVRLSSNTGLIPLIELMEFIHQFGVESTVYLQKSFVGFSDFFVWISVIFDPGYSYIVYFPLLYHLNRKTALQVLWATAITEWVNHVFKWLLFGERPYWWVFENSHIWEAANVTVPDVRQFSITCETGPGSPSGHVMVNSALGFVFVKGVLDATNNEWLKVIGWISYPVCLILIAVSRVFIAAHFPHQCIAGLFAGVCLGYLLCKVPILTFGLKRHLKLAFSMVFVTMGTYFCILVSGMDPSWTIALAKRWCLRSEWVHLNSTPFYMFWRYMATVLSIGVSVSSGTYLRLSVWAYGRLQTVVLVVASFLSVTFLNRLILKSGHEIVVYLSAFGIHLLIPYLVIVLIPLAVMKVSGRILRQNID